MTRGDCRLTPFMIGILAWAGCSGGAATDGPSGSLAVTLSLGGDSDIAEVGYTVSGHGIEPISGTIDVSAPGATASVEVYGLAPATGYLMTMTGTTTDGLFTCAGSTEFDVETGAATEVNVYLKCKRTPPLGGIRVNGKFNLCAQLSKVVVSPVHTSVGRAISLSARADDADDDEIAFEWTSNGGAIDAPQSPDTSFTCTNAGAYAIRIAVSDDADCTDDWTVPVDCVSNSDQM